MTFSEFVWFLDDSCEDWFITCWPLCREKKGKLLWMAMTKGRRFVKLLHILHRRQRKSWAHLTASQIIHAKVFSDFLGVTVLKNLLEEISRNYFFS